VTSGRPESYFFLAQNLVADALDLKFDHQPHFGASLDFVAKTVGVMTLTDFI